MNLIDEAQDLLLHQFSQSPVFKALIRSLVKPFAEAYAEVEKLHHGHYIDDAKGATLDIIGNIVDQPRLGMEDGVYRPWIKVAICLNNCSGTAENMLTILRILFNKEGALIASEEKDRELPIRMQEYASNDVFFTFFEKPKFPVETLFAIMRRAAPVTTKCGFIQAYPAAKEYSEATKLSAGQQAFCFDKTAFSNCYFADFF